MTSMILKAFLAIGFPAAVLVGGSWVLFRRVVKRPWGSSQAKWNRAYPSG